MVKALAHVQDTMGGDTDAAQPELENLQGRLVSLRLLRRNDLVKFHSQLKPGRGKKVVVYVGNDG